MSEEKSLEERFKESLEKGIPKSHIPPSEPIMYVEDSKEAEPSVHSEPTKRTTTKQRKASLEEYKDTFLTVPKIIDRQPVFISRELRDRVDEIVRRMGERRMSVSGFLENLTRHHLEQYAEDIDKWKRM